MHAYEKETQSHENMAKNWFFHTNKQTDATKCIISPASRSIKTQTYETGQKLIFSGKSQKFFFE